MSTPIRSNEENQFKITNHEDTGNGYPNNQQMGYQHQIPQQFQQQMPGNIPNQQFQYPPAQYPPFPGQYPPFPGQYPPFPGQFPPFPPQQNQNQSSDFHEHSLYPINLTPSQQCKICKQNGNDFIGYNCSECNLDICFDCYSKLKNVRQPTQKHNCILNLEKRSDWKCDICEKINPTAFSMHCKSCVFDMCPECYFQEGSAQPPLNGQFSPFPGQILSNPGQQPFPGQILPYPGQQLPYPNQQQFPGQQLPYPNQQQFPGQQLPLQPQPQTQNTNVNEPQNISEQTNDSFNINKIHSHELEYKLNKSKTIYCDLHNDAINEAMVYSCRKCNIDFCENCMKKLLTIYQPTPKHQCYLQYQRCNFHCDICKKAFDKKISMKCPTHNYNICLECYLKLPTTKTTEEPKPKPVVNKGAYEPPHEHPIEPQEMNGEKCDFCGSKANGMGATCEVCKFNFCGDCYYNFTNVEPNKHHKHPLTLIKRHSWFCDVCKKKCSLCPMTCMKCNFDCCHECFYNKK